MPKRRGAKNLKRMIILNKEPKKIAAIHDLSGCGRCSLTAAIPILSVMGLHCCPMPTAVLSNQTGYNDFSYLDFTPFLPDFVSGWRRRALSFDGIYTGFLGSADQIGLVTDFIREFSTSASGSPTLVAVDPVMGDNGRTYPGFSDKMYARMKELVSAADIVFPNLTEALMLTGADPRDFSDPRLGIPALGREISRLGPRKVVITGAVSGDTVSNYVFDFDAGVSARVGEKFNGKSYSGTGDIFASIVCGGLVLGGELESCVRRAAAFVSRVVVYTADAGTDTREGILFEPFLKEL
jgi:pyridoxine kinase